MAVRVQAEDFDPAAEMEALTAGRSDVGALVSFTGLVRGVEGGDAIDALELEHYPGMTEAALHAIAAEAEARWPLQAVLIVHRIGRLLPGARIVLVVTVSAHRRAAFEAAEFVMDYLKTRAPFWKKARKRDGAHWVEARDADAADAARWSPR